MNSPPLRHSCFRLWLLRSSALTWATLASGPVWAEAMLDNLNSWDGMSSISSWGSAGATPTYGESFTATSLLTHLSSATFYIASGDGNANTANYRAQVFNWNGSQVVGSALYTSPIMTVTTPGSGSFVAASVALDAQLTTNNRYAVVYTTENIPQPASSDVWGSNPSQAVAPGSAFVYTNNLISTGGWGGAGFPDLASRLQFTNPLRWDPAQTAGAASGGSGTWNASTTNWKSTDLSSQQAWNSAAASFAGAGGVVMISGQIGFQQLTFTSDGYSIAPQTGSTLVAIGDATILVDGNATTSIAAPISGTGSLLKLGSGTLALSGPNTYAGGTTVSSGAVRIDAETIGVPGAIQSSPLGTGAVTFDSGTLRAGGDFTVANAAFLNMTGGSIDADGHTFTYAGTIGDGNGPGNVSIVDVAGLSGTAVLSGANTYSGGTTLSGGQLRVGLDTDGSPGAINSSAIGTGTLTFDGGTLQAGGDFTVANNGIANPTGGAIDANGHTFTYAGAIADNWNGSGSGTLNIVDGAGLGGTVVLSGANTYSGGTTLSGGQLRVGIDTDGSAGAINSSAIGTGTLTFAGGTLQAGGDFTIANAAVLNVNGGTIDANGHTFTYSGEIDDGTIGNGSITVGYQNGIATSIPIGVPIVNTRPSGLTITDASGLGGTVVLSGPNTYSGGTFLSGGQLRIGTDTDGSPGAINSSAIGTGTLTLDGGVLQAGGNFTVANAGLINSGGGTIDTNGYALTYSGAIGDGDRPGALSITNSSTSPGSVILSGSNTFTGWTTIEAGATLALAGTGSIAASRGLALASGGTFDLSSLTNGGASIATLADASSGQAGTVLLGSNTLTITGGSTSFSGTLGVAGDTGGLAVTGGTQTFVGVVGLYTGATTVAAGAKLMLTGQSSLSASSGVTANGTLDISSNGLTAVKSLSGTGGAVLGANTLTVSSGNFTGSLGTMGDTGGLTKTGAGTFTFAGGNYAGATTIDAGTLIQTGVTAASASIAIAPGATFQTNAANLLDPSAVVNDAGTFVLNNHNQTIGSLTGNGIVQLGTGTLTYAATTDTFSGNVTGAGGLTKAGPSTFTVSGTNTYTGTTNVNAGILNVTGSITGSRVIVNAGGTLAGSGALADPTINAGGTLAPGAVTGVPTTLTVGGPGDPLVFMPGSFYNVIVTPTASDRTIANGATTISGGTVNVVAGAGTYRPQSRFNIITSAGGVTGTFAAVTSNLAFLTPTLVYDPNDVTLVLSRNDIALAAVAATANQRGVANGLTNASRLVQSPVGGSLLNAVAGLSAPQARSAFDSLSGEGITATHNLAQRSSELFTSAIFDQTTFYGAGGGNQISLTAPLPGGLFALAPSEGVATTSKTNPIRELADLPSIRPAFIEAMPVAPVRTWRAWGAGFGGEDEIHGNAGLGSATQNNQIYGGAVGVDYQVLPNALIGIAAGGSDGEFSVPNRATSGSTTGGHVAGYSLASFGPFYGAASVSGSFYQNRTTRNVAGFGGLGSETERGNFSSQEVRTRLEAGRTFASPFGSGATLTPFVALEIASLRTNGFGEQAIAGPGLFALNVSGQSTADVPSFVGLRFASVTSLGNGMVFKPVLQVAYVHEFAPERQQFAGINSLPGAVFLVDGARPARNAAQVRVGGELSISPQSVIFADFDSEVSGVNQFYAGKSGLRCRF